MFNKEDYFLLGTLSKTHGVAGELLLKSGNLDYQDINKMESVFIEFDGILIPFFIEHINPKGAIAAAIKFEGIDSEDQASEFINCNVYSTDFLENEGEDLLAMAISLKGFQVIDQKLGNLGIITEFLNVANNPLFRILKSKREILLPVNEEFVLDIDEDRKIITVQTPEGLIDLYSEK
ncbi:MAG: 16S rRNA processing protein RimM [Bacteroidales bacterium]|nr:16S rRNA processing protein RimM [Bacteroidales bacterium]